ncbi:hypothetical protein DFH07DRAFT_710572, partial [Mycena maculata]
IGSGLLTEVRRLQSFLGEHDKAIQDMKEEKDDPEKSVEGLRAALHQQETRAGMSPLTPLILLLDEYKEENWNLKVTLQDLRMQLSTATAAESAASIKAYRLAAELAASCRLRRPPKLESECLTGVVDKMKAKHEADV